MQNLHSSVSKAMNEKLKGLLEKHKIAENKMRVLEEGLQKQKLEVRELLHYPGFPVDYEVKQSLKREFLSPFYTHPHGYRMCLCVYTNGDGSGKRTHISVYACMMQGPFDEYLKWPFQEKVTVQIVNQAGDHDHVEETISYTAAKSNKKHFTNSTTSPSNIDYKM